jgi:hypothetical protein
MENILILKKTAQSIMLAGVIAFSAAGVAQAAGAGEQTGEYGDMSPHGKGSNAPEPRGYDQSGAASGQGSGQSSGQSGGHNKGHDKSHNKSHGQSSGQGGGSQAGGSSGQSGGGGY